MLTRVAQAMLDGVEGGSAARGYLSGLRLINSPDDLTNDIIVSAGQCRDISNTAMISLLTPTVKRIDAMWSAGNGGGGLDIGGSAAVNSTYHVFCIDGDTVSPDVIFSTSPVSPVLPAGYTLFRRLGSLLTNSAGGILQFLQTGGWFYFTDVQVGADNIAVGTSQFLTLPVPLGIKVRADFLAVPQASTGGANSFLSVKDPDLGVLTSGDAIANFGSAPASAQVECWTDTISRVRIGATVAGLVSVFVRGWYDDRDITT